MTLKNTMKIFINDLEFSCPEQCSLKDALTSNNIELVNIAVAVNSTVISKSQWEHTPLIDGSRIIIIKAVQGG